MGREAGFDEKDSVWEERQRMGNKELCGSRGRVKCGRQYVGRRAMFCEEGSILGRDAVSGKEGIMLEKREYAGRVSVCGK